MSVICFFFFNDTATTEIYTLSLHDALPISVRGHHAFEGCVEQLATAIRLGVYPTGSALPPEREMAERMRVSDRKSTRLNSSHANISYAVFCLKKKKKKVYSNKYIHQSIIKT